MLKINSAPLNSVLDPRHQPAKSEKPDSSSMGTARPASSLADSILSDGGLGFLRSRMEEKMGALFEKAAEDNPELAAAGPQAFFNSDVDMSPEATADRIVGFALGLKGVFQRQNQDLDQAEMMARFESEIRKGIGEGFDHARGALSNLGLLEDSVRDNVDTTWDLVQQKLDEFFHPREEEESGE